MDVLILLLEKWREAKIEKLKVVHSSYKCYFIALYMIQVNVALRGKLTEEIRENTTKVKVLWHQYQFNSNFYSTQYSLLILRRECLLFPFPLLVNSN
jgi:hypothetical protein